MTTPPGSWGSDKDPGESGAAPDSGAPGPRPAGRSLFGSDTSGQFPTEDTGQGQQQDSSSPRSSDYPHPGYPSFTGAQGPQGQGHSQFGAVGQASGSGYQTGYPNAGYQAGYPDAGHQRGYGSG